ncbi:MAG TPA: sporulation protein YabP [Firmicutes bacterium]|jgi:sporulation protein YabP|nr:sporulation protein YabP [Eubacteriales bacterium]HCX77999.1 sporulation protein YabP [Bacillota bacterium]
MAESKIPGTEHKLVLLNQEQMDLSGISRVESFNPEEILLETSLGLLTIKGEGLDMHNLNLERGVVEIAGLVTEIRYSERTAGKRSILEKIFR